MYDGYSILEKGMVMICTTSSTLTITQAFSRIGTNSRSTPGVPCPAMCSSSVLKRTVSFLSYSPSLHHDVFSPDVFRAWCLFSLFFCPFLLPVPLPPSLPPSHILFVSCPCAAIGYFLFDLAVILYWMLPMWTVFLVHHLVAL